MSQSMGVSCMVFCMTFGTHEKWRYCSFSFILEFMAKVHNLLLEMMNMRSHCVHCELIMQYFSRICPLRQACWHLFVYWLRKMIRKTLGEVLKHTYNIVLVLFLENCSWPSIVSKVLEVGPVVLFSVVVIITHKSVNTFSFGPLLAT